MDLGASPRAAVGGHVGLGTARRGKQGAVRPTSSGQDGWSSGKQHGTDVSPSAWGATGRTNERAATVGAVYHWHWSNLVGHGNPVGLRWRVVDHPIDFIGYRDVLHGQAR